MRYATVFSGIEAPTVAWDCLGWEPQWFAEIEPFPSGALDHLYPHVPNLGDMTKLKETLTDEQKNIQVLCGGSPCQSFSIAGLREGLADPRGNLTLEYVRLVDAIRPEWVIWENVPGVLSANGGEDFQAFLDAMGHVGYYGAYRVLDAQYFGVPQRRRRVFAIFCPGDGTRAVEVLFERQSVCGYTPPSREAGQEAPRNAAIGIDEESNASVNQFGPLLRGGQGGTRQAVMVMAHGQGGAEIMEDHAPTLSCNHEAPIAFSSIDDGRDAAVDVSPTLRIGSGGNHGNPPAIAFTQNDAARDASVDVTPTLRSGNSGGTVHQAVAIHPHQIGRKDEAGPQGKGWLEDGVAYTHDNRGVAQAVAIRTAQTSANGIGVAEEVTHTLDGAQGQAVAMVPAAYPGQDPRIEAAVMEGAHWGMSVVRRLTELECERLQGFPDNYTLIPWKGKPTEDCPMGPRYKALGNSMAVPVMRWIGTRIHLLEAGLGVYL